MSRIALRGALVVDGTGASGGETDVTSDGDTIVSVGPAGSHDSVVDLDGLVLAPGFIDPHTHLDAQVLWDPDLTPSSWHGVTTAVVGNCGFGIAPARPEHRDTLAHALVGLAEGASRRLVGLGENFDPDEIAREVSALAWAGLRAVQRPTKAGAAPADGTSSANT